MKLISGILCFACRHPEADRVHGGFPGCPDCRAFARESGVALPDVARLLSIAREISPAFWE